MASMRCATLSANPNATRRASLAPARTAAPANYHTCISSGAPFVRRIGARAADDPDTVAAPSVVSPPPTVDPPTPASAESPEPVDSTPEEVFYEGPGSNAELILSLVLLPTLFYAPLSIASIGRRLWIKFRFTNKRMSIINSSPLFSRTLEISYDKIKEIRSAPRGFGAWGDMVVFLKDGSRVELTGLDKYKEIVEYINRQRYTIRS